MASASGNTMIINQIDYTPKNHREWFYKALRKSKTLDNDYVRVIPGVTDSVRLQKLVMNANTVSQVDGRDCAWTPTQRFTISPMTLQVANFKINEEQCLEDLDSVYSEMVYRTIGATKDEWPSNEGEGEGLESAVMFHLQNALGQDVEKLIWGGAANAVAGVHNGIIDKALADTNTIKVTGQTIDATNVVAEIKKVYDAIPDLVLNEGEFDPVNAPVKIFVDIKTMRYLKQALSTQQTAYQVILPSFAIEGGKIYYMGVEIVSVGVPTGYMVAASKDNLVFVTDLLSDTTEIRAQMGNDLIDESKWYAKGSYRAASGYIFGDELVIYAP